MSNTAKISRKKWPKFVFLEEKSSMCSKQGGQQVGGSPGEGRVSVIEVLIGYFLRNIQKLSPKMLFENTR